MTALREFHDYEARLRCSTSAQIEEKVHFGQFLQSFSFTRENEKLLKFALEQHS